jgi:Radical SAM superfamily.
MNYDSNKELQQREIEQGKEVLESRPTSLVVTLTTKCNIRCRMCEEYRIPWEMPEKTMREIVSLFPYLDDVLWQGGEVLILDYFLNTLLPEASKYPQLHQSIITNGLPITPDLADRLVSDNMELTFSIDGANKSSYETIRRGASFNRLTENVRLVGKLREKKKPKNMSLRMHSVIMKSSYRELTDFVTLAKDLGFDALHLMPIWGNLEGDENIFHRQDREALAFLEEHIPEAEEKGAAHRIEPP